MTITEIEPVEVTEETHDPDLVHLGCCTQNRSVCGISIEGEEETEDDPNCVVCVDLGMVAMQHLRRTGHVHCPLDFGVICPKVEK